MNQRFPFFVLLTLLLTSCGDDVRETLGLTKDAPDEFVVVSRPPLSVPPDFELRPPGSDEAATARTMPTTQTSARETLFGVSPSDMPAEPVEKNPPVKKPQQSRAGTTTLPDVVVAPASESTDVFLKKAGASDASPDIRQQLIEDKKQPLPVKDAGSLYEQLIDKEKADPVVDAKKESKRLLENKQDGKPVTEGDTPNAPPASPSLLDKIF